MEKLTNIHVGTSGWHYKHWVGKFYPDKMPASRMLQYYLRFFDTVEVNNSFYRLPKPEAFENWRASTPDHFTFAVKASRFLTHNKKLKDPENALAKFLPLAERLGSKLGPILFQLPPQWGCNVDRLESFLSALPRRHRYAFEFREQSWHCESVLKVLQRHNAAFCIYELAGFISPSEITADWTYVRLHGPGGKYQGSYTDETLLMWVDQFRRWRNTVKDIYVYFDNDQAGYAAANALRLKTLLKSIAGLKAA